MVRSRMLHVGLSSAIGCAALLMTASSQAATIQLTEANITRDTSLRDQAYNPLWISRADCLYNGTGDVMHFPLYLQGISGSDTLQVWVGGAGSDCTQVASRSSTTAVCWPVWSGYVTTQNVTVDLRVQDIVGQHYPAACPSGQNCGTAADCTPISGSSTAPQTINIYFLLLPGAGSSVLDGQVYWSTKYDLLGPNAPPNVHLGVGDSMLNIYFDQTTDSDLTGYQFFCDPIPGSEGQNSNVHYPDGGAPQSTAKSSAPAVNHVMSSRSALLDVDASCDPDSGTCEEAGAEPSLEAGADAEASVDATSSDAETSVPTSACPSDNLFQSIVPDGKFLCGSVSGMGSTSGRISGLQNYDTYTIGVAGVDGVGNVGPLGNIVCATPMPVDDFFKLYKMAGGKGGGAFCATSGGVGHSAGLAAFAGIALAAAASIVRRRRSR